MRKELWIFFRKIRWTNGVLLSFMPLFLSIENCGAQVKIADTQVTVVD
jgi:hypothetical protein